MYLPPPPQSSVSTPVFTIQLLLFLNFPYLKVSSPDSSCSCTLLLFAWFVLLLISNLSLFPPSLSHRCKEGYHGLRCDQFVPKTDAILSDPSTFSFLFFILQFWCIDLKHENKFITNVCYKLLSESLTALYQSTR